jgi:nicotinate-nucleotide adenylyltransferase
MIIFSQPQQVSQNIGLFGGTFNPLHQGHLQVAKDVLQQFQLDKILFIPCAVPPHKNIKPLAKASHRLEMVRLSLVGQSNLTVSDVEIQRKGPSYTCDTLRYFKRNLPAGARLHFLVGLDAFLEIHTWESFSRLFDEAVFIVMNRPGIAATPSIFLKTVLDFAQSRISAAYQLADGKETISHPNKQPIYLASVTPVAMASSQIRQMIQRGESIKPWVTPAVANYIEEKGLYR